MVNKSTTVVPSRWYKKKIVSLVSGLVALLSYSGAIFILSYAIFTGKSPDEPITVISNYVQWLIIVPSLPSLSLFLMSIDNSEKFN